MHQINAWLSIGKWRETTDLSLLNIYGISAMLQLADHAPQPGIDALYVPVEDGSAIPEDAIEKAMAFVRQHRDGHVLIACGAGISRSTAFSMAALHEIEGITLLDAFHLIRRHHPDAMPHPALLKSLCEFYDERASLPKLIRESTGFYPE